MLHTIPPLEAIHRPAAKTELDKVLVNLFQVAFPGFPVDIVPASFGSRLIVGEPIPITSESWHSRFINKNGKGDITGEVGFCVFYSEGHRIWKGSEVDQFDLKDLVVVVALGREKNSPVHGGFYKMLAILPEYAERYNCNFLIEQVTNTQLRDFFKADPNWKFTRCGTFGEEGDASFYLKRN